MALYVRDEAVNDLASKLAAMTGRNKTEALRYALERAIAEEAGRKSLAQRLRPVLERAQALGLAADGHDDKAFMDELSGGL